MLSHFKVRRVVDLQANHVARLQVLLGHGLYSDPLHPIYNFIFQYFHFSVNKLMVYSPGLNTSIPEPYTLQYPFLQKYTERTNDGTYVLDPRKVTFNNEKVKAMRVIQALLEGSASRPPSYSCFGLHEFAILYEDECTGSTASTSNSKSSRYRHQHLPLRISVEELRQTVESRPLRCTHFDALRFFAKSALPLNRIVPSPSRETQPTLDQPGCVHVHMDLFKWAMKLYPFLPSEVLVDSLEIALKAREIDMRASPYDLRAYKCPPAFGAQEGLGACFSAEPIKVETPEVNIMNNAL
jgi:hypothetical protein